MAGALGPQRTRRKSAEMQPLRNRPRASCEPAGASTEDPEPGESYWEGRPPRPQEQNRPPPSTTWTPMPIGERAPILSCPAGPGGLQADCLLPSNVCVFTGGEYGCELILGLPPIACPAGAASRGPQGGQAAGDSQGSAQPPKEVTPALAGPAQHKCTQTPRPARPSPGLHNPSPGPARPLQGVEVGSRYWSALRAEGVSE